MDNNIENIEVITVELSDEGTRIDALISEKTDMSRSAAAKLADGGNIRIFGKSVAKNYKVKAGEEIEIELPEAIPDKAEAENIALDIIYEDGDIIVVNKPTGMVVHPAAGNYTGTLVNGLLYHCKNSLSGIGGVVRPGIVHRIDKDTSGLLVVAKNDEAHKFLAEQLKVHNVSRIYYAIVIGNFSEDKGTIDAPIGRHPTDRKKMAVINGGKGTSRNAVTHFEVIERYRGFSLVKCRLETGRTHQIRVHMAYKGHAILGDAVYGGNKTTFEASNKNLIHGQCLHAKELILTHPRSRAEMKFECPLPNDMLKLIEKLEKNTIK